MRHLSASVAKGNVSCRHRGNVTSALPQGAIMKRFTDIAIRNLKPKDRAYEVSDPGARGLRIVVFPSGKKSFIVRYRRPDGKSAKLTLGQIPLTTARKVAGDANYEVQQGRDPGTAKQAAKATAAAAAADTVQAVCTEYLKRAGI